MHNRVRFFLLLFILALFLFACQLAGQIGQGPAEPASPPTASRELFTQAGKPSHSTSEIPTTTQPAATSNLDPTQNQAPQTTGPNRGAYPKPPQSRAGEIRPTEMRPALTHLSSLIGYRVLDINGGDLGQVSDFIVNTCETYLLYFLMEPGTGLKGEPGRRVVIPYEALTVNSGILDAQAKTIQLRLAPEQLVGAPAFPADQPLTPTDWETAVRDFWSKAVRIGSLKTSCNIPGGPVYKVAYASQLLGAPL